MSELIPETSPLCRHPVMLEPRQRLILDGIRYSVEITELAFQRLNETLSTISQASEDALPRAAFVTALADSWTIIDSVSRLRTLVTLMPGAMEADYVQEFLSQTKVALLMRNAVQHIHGRLEKLLSLKQPTWGTVSWVTLEAEDLTKGKIHLLLPGSLQRGEFPMPNPSGESFRALLDLITLKAHGYSIRIIDLVGAVAVFIRRFQENLSKQVRDLPHAAAEVYIRMEFEFDPDNIQKPPEGSP
jgi:hypothetical protein